MERIQTATTLPWPLLASCLALLSAVLAFVVKTLYNTIKKSKTKKPYPPGPRAFPVLGSLHLMAGHDDLPYKAFDLLYKKYGPVVRLRLGAKECVVVSTLDTVKEVLINKGEQFDSRPPFARYTNIFGGNRDNSLAFCDWSEEHKIKREMIREHTFARTYSPKFNQLESIVRHELKEMLDEISNQADLTNLKPLMLHFVANMFFSYLSSVRFERSDTAYTEMLKSFDLVFYEVNQGYAVDFLPWLKPFYRGTMTKTRDWGKHVRHFVHERVIAAGGKDGDLLSSLLHTVKTGIIDMEMALFAFEDMVGGHCAVANFLLKALSFVARYPEVQKKMQEEVDSICDRKTQVTFEDRPLMPYIEAVLMECVRHVCSPIVPHVASQDTTINDYHVDEGTLVFLNNYTLNMSPELWTEPQDFRPERFITPEGGLLKPEHFLPFGGGRRSCMGSKMMQFISFATLANLMQRFSISLVSDSKNKVTLGDLALPYDTVQFNFIPR